MVDTFLNVEGTPSILRIETTKEAQEIKIPPFLQVLREVTDDAEYESVRMADNDYQMRKEDKDFIDKALSPAEQD